ncbi:TIR domain-containing protein [Endozoicomonas sp.]|uniref:TIR domain-containing protein n=1 Tax=Endozoicomonas sp. TaxID=1892382 RepID=UPI00383AF6DE
MQKVFISYATNNIQYVRDIRSMANNPNNDTAFIDSSLPEPVRAPNGSIIKKSPHHESAAPVRNEIHSLLVNSDKLLVIVGPDTHSRKWVEWEIKMFRKLHTDDDRILLVRCPNDQNSGMPKYISDIEIIDWQPEVIKYWLFR